MPQLCLITVPGLQVRLDWAAVHDRLLDDFPQVTDVLATTMTATLLIAYEGDAEIDAWLHEVSEGILSRRMRAAHATRHVIDPRLPARAELQEPAGKESFDAAS